MNWDKTETFAVYCYDPRVIPTVQICIISITVWDLGTETNILQQTILIMTAMTDGIIR